MIFFHKNRVALSLNRSAIRVAAVASACLWMALAPCLSLAKLPTQQIGVQGQANAPARVDSLDTSATTDVPSDPYIDHLSAGARKAFEGGLPVGAIQTALILGVLSIAPAILLMTTSYVRIVVVLGLLRQALGAQQLPPTQVLAALSVFVSILIMTPVWQEIRREAIDPCLQSSGPVDWDEVCQRGVAPLKKFMVAQIVGTGNVDSINVFNRYAQPQSSSLGSPSSAGPALVTAETVNNVPMSVILPAFLVSELKVAFLLGFQIFLPFLVLDLIVSTLGVSMGMVMLPPSMVSLPLKLILFVMADGWNLVMGMLLQSFHSGMPVP
jgi:flagellar biosynthetic protein FliP